MAKNLHAHRKSYEKGELKDGLVSENPFTQFEQWFSVADESDLVYEANAMTLSTSDANGMPNARIVLLKEFSEDGFVFFTNYNSDKGQAIAANNQVCISFFWIGLERQVIIKGNVVKVSEEASKSYFSSRPRESQLGALVSNQSETIDSRVALEEKLSNLEQQYEGKEIPKPDHWGGYLITPVSFEFWQGRRSRLHDRIQYTLEDCKWTKTRLQP
ncbi:Pyridoxamine 5'-phosphate oxidase [unidentified eubacterium SCB49]|nr:Pyridoxamine 5'-phosphate oxidase [unidentified eubacterium SCB49]